MSWEPDFRVDSFAQFENEILVFAGDYFHSADSYHECAKSVFADRLARNVRYMEVSFALGCVFLNLNGSDVCDSIRDAVPQGLEVRVFLGIHHDGFTLKMRLMLDEALTFAKSRWHRSPWGRGRPYWELGSEVLEKDRDAGKFAKAHAGDFMGADFVRYVVEALGVRRIEHGIRSIENPAVLDLLCERVIALNVGPISNLKLGVLPSASAHPLRRLMDSGITCKISADDPINFGNNIEDEYLFLGNELGFTTSELSQVARNGVEVALFECAGKREILSEVVDVFGGN